MARYPEQIKAAQADIDALQTDLLELERLHDERASTLKTMQAEKSRDFARMAELEGQRAALSTMLSEQRGEVEQAQVRLSQVQAQAQREQHLQAIGTAAQQIGQTREQLFSGLQELVQTLTPEMQRLIELRGRWSQLRQGWLAEAFQMGIPLTSTYVQDGDEAKIEAFFLELEARGVDVHLLRTPLAGFLPEILSEKTEFLPTYTGELNYTATFSSRIKEMIGGWFGQALGAYNQASLFPTSAPGSAPIPPLSERQV